MSRAGAAALIEYQPERVERRPAIKTHPAAALALIALSVASTIAVLELALRLIATPDDRFPRILSSGDPLYQPDARLSYSLIPNSVARFQRAEFFTSVRTNAHGYRDDEFNDPSTDALTIVGLGDSFAFGHGVEHGESFFEVAEHVLADVNPGARVHNLAVSGYCQRQHLEQLDLAIALGADRVVLAVHTSNDVLENGGIIERRLDERSGWQNRVARGRDARYRDEPPDWLEHKSELYRRIAARLGQLPRNLAVGSAAWYVFDQLREDPSDPVRAAFATTERLLAEIDSRLAKASVEWTVLIVPAVFEVNPELLRRAATRHGIDAKDLDPRRVIDFYRGFAEARGIPVVDMASELRRRLEEPERAYFPRDRHFNELGHRITGETLARASLRSPTAQGV